MDYRGLVLIAGGVALSVFGFQQSVDLGLEQSRRPELCIAAGVVLLVVVLLRRASAPPRRSSR